MAGTEARKSWMSLLAKSDPDRLADLWRRFGDRPGFVWMRAPEPGAVMVRGRTGAAGQPFNLGEITVTRCALQLDSGETGHAYVQGRDKTHAERAALIDALMQTAMADRVRDAILTPLETEAGARRRDRAARAAATRVEFFTLVRGED